MARVNIENSLFTDERFLELLRKTRSTEEALGSLVRYWIVAQRFWNTNKNGIPRPEWARQKLPQVVIDVGLAEDRGDFIYVCGSESQFSWLIQRRTSGRHGGIASGITRQKALVETIDEKLKQTEANGSKRNPPSPSPSLKEKNIYTPDEIKNAWEIWQGTLNHFGIPSKAMNQESEIILARAIKSHGVGTVYAALEGARYEKGFDKFNPKENLTLARIFQKNGAGYSRVEKFENLALMQKREVDEGVKNIMIGEVV